MNYRRKLFKENKSGSLLNVEALKNSKDDKLERE